MLQSNSDNNTGTSRQKRPLWRRLLKYLGIGVLTLIGLVITAVCVALWYLTPEKLTPIVNRVASRELLADVRTSRVELTFWSTFPRLEIRADSIRIVSRRFDEADDELRVMLPADADSLLFMERLEAGINPLKLLSGEVCLHDVRMIRPQVNLVVADDMANFEIVPDTNPDKDDSSLPKITIDRFVIDGDMPVRYRSLCDSIDATLTVTSTSLKGTQAPMYSLNLVGNMQGGLLTAMLDRQTIGLNGKVQWDQQKASRVSLDDFNIIVGAVDLHLTTAVDFSENIEVEYLRAELRDLDVKSLVKMVTPYLGEELRDLDTDMTVNAGLVTDKPFAPLSGRLPDMEVSIDAHSTYLKFDKVKLPSLWLDVKAMIDGSRLDNSVIELNRFALRGPAMDFEIKGNVRNPLSDPVIKGEFHGTLSMQRLPRQLLDRLPFTLHGAIKGDAGVNLRMSYLTRTLFHRVKIDGNLDIDDFSLQMRDSTLSAYTRHADLHLGTSSRISIKGYDVDSLLTLSLNIDTVAFYGDGIRLQAKALRAGIGTKNIVTSSDTSIINPIGGRISVDRIRFFSEADSVRVNLREAVIKGGLLRYKGDNRAPQVNMDIEARRMAYGDGVNRASIGGSHVQMTLHPRSRNQASVRLQAMSDSLASVYPELESDSLMKMARAELRRTRRNNDDGRAKITYVEDKTVRAMLRRWQASGELSARRVRLASPYFPLRNTITGLDMKFSTDSVIIGNTKIRTGNTDFTVNGAIRNIYRALTSRRGTPLEVDFTIDSDTIDINDIAAASIRGMAYSVSSHGGGDLIDMDFDLEELQENNLPSAPDTVDIPAIVVPSNLNANLHIGSKNVRYNDLWLNDFRGTVSVYDGAVNMREFSARTGIGSFGLTALYSAPTRNDVSFAAGLVVKQFNLKEVHHVIPAIDSVLPMLKYMQGIVNVNGALTTRIDSLMNIDIATTNMMLKFSGDSLVLLDSDTFRKVAKWLMFKNKKRNMIDHMDVEVSVHDGVVDVYPFIFDLDRYKLGVRGSNDAALNLDYHVSVLKSPIPFKFGINIKGTPDNMKIRLGGAKVNEKSVATSHHIADTVRVNLLKEIRTAFRKGIRTAGAKGLKLQRMERSKGYVEETVPDTFTHQDSLVLIEQGLIEVPKPDSIPVIQSVDKKSKRKRQ
ncbi:MAG: hypothetical protein K2M94_01205 [Paramuribaculum sp.]|nr:hypothetical protein [Paramuribaculum sp.]